MKIVVYTAIYGKKDPLWSVPPIARDGTDYVVLTDRRLMEVGLWTLDGSYGRRATILTGTGEFPSVPTTWEQRKFSTDLPSWDRMTPRRRARYCKMMPHVIFPEADVTVWVDGNIRLLRTPRRAVAWLTSNNIAAFRHPDRRCIYEEAKACMEFGKGSRKEILAQINAYRKAGYPANRGLISTRCVIRRNCDEINWLNEAWWREIRERSERDQISLPFLLWKMGIDYSHIPGSAIRGSDFWFIMHGAMP